MLHCRAFFSPSPLSMITKHQVWFCSFAQSSRKKLKNKKACLWLNKKNKWIKRTNADEREFTIPVMVLCLHLWTDVRVLCLTMLAAIIQKKMFFFLFLLLSFLAHQCVGFFFFYPAWPHVLTSCWKERQKKKLMGRAALPLPARPSLHCTVNHCIFPPLSSCYSHPPSTGASLRRVLRQTPADYRRSRNLLSEISSPVLQPAHNSHFTVPPSPCIVVIKDTLRPQNEGISLPFMMFFFCYCCCCFYLIVISLFFCTWHLEYFNLRTYVFVESKGGCMWYFIIIISPMFYNYCTCTAIKLNCVNASCCVKKQKTKLFVQLRVVLNVL